MTLETGFIFVISLILLWIKPGPGQAAIITRSLNDGFFAGLCVAAGITVGVASYFLITALGIAFIQGFIEQIGFFFKLIGASFMFYLGYRGLRDLETGAWQGKKDTLSHKEITKNFMTGLLITLSNPFVIFFFLGILPSIVPLGELGWDDIVICVILIVYFGMLTDGIIAALAAQVRTTLTDIKTVKMINRLTSVGFVLIGGFLLFSAIMNFDGTFNIL